MTGRMIITLFAVSLWIVHKSTTECVQIFPANGKALRYYKELKPSLTKNLSGPLPRNSNDRILGANLGFDKSRSILTAKFVTCFTERILSSPRLAELYDTSLPSEKAEGAYGRIVFAAVSTVQTQDARTVTNFVSRAIRATFDRLTQTHHVQAYGYSLAEFMISMNVLTHRNVAELCHSYVKHNEREAKYLPHIPDRRYAFIQAISDSLMHFMTSLGTYRADSVESLCQNFADFLYHVAGVSKVAAVSNVPGVSNVAKKSCPEDDLVDIFAAYFTNSVMASPKLAEIYDTSFSPEEAAEAYLRVVTNSVSNVHACNPMAVASVCSHAIRDTFDSLSPTQHVLAHGYTVARCMKDANVLCCENVRRIADSYVNYVAEAAENVPSVPDRRYAFIQSVSNAHVHVMSSLDLFEGDGTFLVAKQFAKSLHSITGVPDTRNYDPPRCYRNYTIF